jgi:hypothetical protein
MPPQQPDRLLDLFDDGLCFRAHLIRTEFRNEAVRQDLTIVSR